MIKDYSIYDLSGKEKIIFYSVGYMCIFIIVYLFYHSLLLAVSTGVLVYYIMPYIKKHMAEKRLDALNMQFKDMLYSISASIAAGRQMEEAIVEAESNLALIYKETDPMMVELKHMRINIIENNESDKPLLQDLAYRSKSEDINDFVQVFNTCRDMGGDIEKMITQTVDVLTEKMAIEREIKVLTAQKKVEGRIISVMPMLMLLALNICSYSYIEPLYETTAGRLIMTAALAATVYGMYLMEKISQIKV
ncbi:MAG: hypothetical protein Q4B18_03605 [Bacillota bacterium]|nr:hypothetical protein [Bacillota bacterium]